MEEASATTGPALSVRTRPYFVNGVVDFLFIGGFSMLAVAAAAAFGMRQSTPALYALATFLLWVGNWPHFAASTYRLYESRETVRQYPLTAFLVPWVILVSVFAAFLAPDRVAPYLVKLYIVWSPYHFSAQTFGVTMIYARRAGFLLDRWERVAVLVFIFGMYFTTMARGEVGEGIRDYFSIPYANFGLPSWKLPGRDSFLVTDVADAVMYGGGAAFVVLLVRRWRRTGQRIPWMLFVPSATQYVWFIVGTSWVAFYEFVPFFHSLQYLFLAWAVRLKGKLDREGVAPSPRFVCWESLRWAIWIVVGGAILFYALPFVGKWVTGTTLLVATGIVTAAVQIHHFFVDGVIWKLRSKSVSSPLMVNLDDLIHAPQPKPERAVAV